MPTWRVTLNGGSWDLKSLADLGLGVTEEGGGFVLRSPGFDTLTDASEVSRQTGFNDLPLLAPRTPYVCCYDYEVSAPYSSTGTAARERFQPSP